MKRYIYHLMGLAAALVFSSFAAIDNTYEEQIRDWHQKRVESLKAESGWLNLAGRRRTIFFSRVTKAGRSSARSRSIKATLR